MAEFFKATAKKAPKNKYLKNILIEKLDHQGRGIATIQNKPLFIEGALIGERLDIEITDHKKRFSKGSVNKVVTASALRIEPKCAHYAECGGCHLQHCNNASQREIKESGLKALFKRFAKQSSVALDNAVFESEWGYRRTARFGLQFNKKSKIVEMGFRKKGTNELVCQKTCPVLLPELEKLIQPLKKLLNTLKTKSKLGHVELIVSDQGVIVLLRHLQTLTSEDCILVEDFSAKHALSFYVQLNNNEINCIYGEEYLTYQLAAWDCTFNFAANDFLQVNEKVNQKMVAQALSWLNLHQDDRVLDLFCGLGNFTLPIARTAKRVVGIEGVQHMVDRATRNAKLNQIENASFYQADLSSDKIIKSDWLVSGFNKVLLDPARAGAYECMAFIIKLKPTHIVYVSCDPVTLARDSQQLFDAGYHLDKLCLLDMFPQTAHMESMALFTKK